MQVPPPYRESLDERGIRLLSVAAALCAASGRHAQVWGRGCERRACVDSTGVNEGSLRAASGRLWQVWGRVYGERWCG
eukprot:335779-Chlamydomonas_euryale.AAC.1